MSAADRLPAWSLIAPLAAAAFVTARALGLTGPDATVVLALSAVLLGASVFAAVHHAEVLALRLGEPFGSILLAVAVTVIEVALIVSILLSGAENSTAVARDTVFAAVMIVLNGVVGLCLVLGGVRHRVQTFRIDGAAPTLAVIGTLATLALVIPNFSESAAGPLYSMPQLLVVGAASLVLYGVFVFVQTVRHRDYFLDPTGTALAVAVRPSARISAAALVVLLVALVAVVLLAKMLSYPLAGAVRAAGLPDATVGVAIAMLVLLPEGMAAANAALANRLQSSVNLALGSAVASIGLTIPVVAVVSVVAGLPLVLGLSGKNMVLLLLTLFAGTLTLGTGRTTVLHGAVHLVIFAVFLLLTVIP